MIYVVLRRSGPQWDPARPLEEQSGWPEHAGFMDARVALVVESDDEPTVRRTLARDPWHETHLQIESVDRWTIRLDGRRR